MKKYKLFYRNVEVAEFDKLEDVSKYIYEMVREDELLAAKFVCYIRI